MKLPSIMDYGFEITSYPDHECWILSAEQWNVPSKDQWDAYQALAGHILAATQAYQYLNPPF